MSLIAVGASDVGSLARGHDLRTAGVLSAVRSHMRMGALSCSGSALGDTVSDSVGLQDCGSGSGSCKGTLPKRRAQRLWIATISSGGASWTPLMVLVRRHVASTSKMRLVAVMTGTGIAWC